MKLNRTIGASALSLAALASLAGCSSSGVFDRERPDEFAVTKAAPLQVPADLSTLPAPQPGAASKTKDTKQDVLNAMFGAPKQ
jgi:predicted GNAT superfamily acetyltransferase